MVRRELHITANHQISLSSIFCCFYYVPSSEHAAPHCSRLVIGSEKIIEDGNSVCVLCDFSRHNVSKLWIKLDTKFIYYSLLPIYHNFRRIHRMTGSCEAMWLHCEVTQRDQATDRRVVVAPQPSSSSSSSHIPADNHTCRIEKNVNKLKEILDFEGVSDGFDDQWIDTDI